MLMLSQRLLEMPIVSIQTGGQLARVASAIIDPRQLRIVAFYCQGPNIEDGSAVLHTEDIREVGQLGMIIDSADEIMNTDDLVRLKQVIGFKFKLEDKLVTDDHGHKLGKVSSYSVEVGTFYIIKLHVKPGILASFKTTELIIDRSQIIEITPQKIVVKAPTIQEKKAKEAESTPPPMPVVDNPFRRRSPQIDTTQTNN